jgi:glutamine---fructose-6-phosphate transaminase (isomerizing)
MGAGEGMAADIAEQPEVFERLLSTQAPTIAHMARMIAEKRPRQVIFTARGTSDHAALYAAYLTEIRLGVPAGLASPSTITIYGARPDLRDCLMVGVSQSGGSPDLTEVLRVAREQGALTLAVTNAADSSLAATADLHVDVSAGPERAVAATKTYTAELLTLHLLVESVLDPAAAVAAVRDLPELAAQTLDHSGHADVAGRYRFADRVITTGRGYAYPTARECALKMMETSYLAGLSFSGADLLHGPLAMADPDIPVLAVVGDGPAGQSMADVLTRLRSRGADVVTVGPDSPWLPTPRVDERIAPMLDILPLQRLALTLALARGENPDAPRGLKKVTATL